MTAPRFALVARPTPLEPADRLGTALGLGPGVLWVKRDDLAGPAGGGNKARKLEWLVGHALATGADVLVTGGGAQSNHCRLTAAAAARAGLGCRLVLAGDPPALATGNVLLDQVLGASVTWLGRGADLWALDDRIAEACDRVRADGGSPYAIPLGGSSPLGCRGYIDAADEILVQQPDVATVVVATGSGGTHAGLVAGLGDHRRVLGVVVGGGTGLADLVADRAAAAAALAGRPVPTGSVWLDDAQVGRGYGAVTETGVAAIELAARTEGLVLDPVYTGKAMAGLVAAAREGRIGDDGPVVFVHTGGLPGLLADAFGEVWPVP